MDSNKDGVVMLEELLGAVDNCPAPEVREIPVQNTRPRVNFEGRLICIIVYDLLTTTFIRIVQNF
jgi:hypothetical protein